MPELDLFGREARPPARFLRPLPAPVKLYLFATAAERVALASGRPKSQELAELIAPNPLVVTLTGNKTPFPICAECAPKYRARKRDRKGAL